MYSPAMVFDNGIYHLWSISNDYKVQYIESKDLTTSYNNKKYTPAKIIMDISKDSFDNKDHYSSPINKINDSNVLVYSIVSKTGDWYISLRLR